MSLPDGDNGSANLPLQVARFHIGDGNYAVDVMRVAEVLNLTRITPVPDAPKFVDGIADVRGRFHPVVDLRRRFSKPAREGAKVLMVVLAGQKVGLIVDGVTEVAAVMPEEMEPAPVTGNRWVSGVTRRDGDVVFVVDVDRLLDEDEMKQLIQMQEKES